MTPSPYQIASALSFIILLSTILWTTIGLGGLGTSNEQLINWHPILAVLAVIVILPQASVIWTHYRDKISNVSTPEEIHYYRLRTKIIHALLMFSSFLIISIAIAFAFSAHLKTNRPNFFSLHSWVGVGMILCLKGNLFGGLVAVVFPNNRHQPLIWRAHRFLGFSAVCLAFITATLGFAEMQLSISDRKQNSFAIEAVIGGILGLLCLLVGLMFMDLLAMEMYKYGRTNSAKDNISERTVSSFEIDSRRRNAITVC